MQQREKTEFRTVELQPGLTAKVELRRDNAGTFRGRLADRPRAPEFTATSVDDVLAAIVRAYRDSAPQPGKHFR